jgi:hypothetical protein
VVYALKYREREMKQVDVFHDTELGYTSPPKGTFLVRHSDYIGDVNAWMEVVETQQETIRILREHLKLAKENACV